MLSTLARRAKHVPTPSFVAPQHATLLLKRGGLHTFTDTTFDTPSVSQKSILH